MEISPKFRKLLSGETRGPAPACARFGLLLLSFAYGIIVCLRNWLYDTGLRAERNVERPVISVGNLTVGGTGKTPATEWLVRWFTEHGVRPAILSRGYRSKEGRNDEAMLLAARLPGVPHRQQPNRFRAALEAIHFDGANVLVLDDGFQHRRLARFGDIVLVDATCPFGYGRLLPGGLLREPKRSLRRADAIVITRSDLVNPTELDELRRQLDGIAPDVPKATSRHAPTALVPYPNGSPQPPGFLSGKSVGLFCSIGNPAAFRRTVEMLGASVVWTVEFPDHHWFTDADIEQIVQSDASVQVFVTTEKDAAKLNGRWPRDRALMVLRVEMELLSGKEALLVLLEEALQASLYDEE